MSLNLILKSYVCIFHGALVRKCMKAVPYTWQRSRLRIHITVFFREEEEKSKDLKQTTGPLHKFCMRVKVWVGIFKRLFLTSN